MHRFMSYFFVLLLVGSCFLLTSCGDSAGYIDFECASEAGSMEDAQDMDELPLRVAFASVISPQETRKSYQMVVDYLSKNMERPAILIQKKTYEDLNRMIAGGEADVVFQSTGAYTSYRGVQPMELLAMAETDGSVLYYTYLIVPTDSGVETFEQLEGRTFAFTDPLSYSGRLAIDDLLIPRKIAPEQFFKQCFYTHSHDKSIWAVANHLADAASVDSQIYDYATRSNPHLIERVRILAKLDASPTGPVVMRADLPEKEKATLRRLFFEMAEQETMRDALHRVMIDRFVPPERSLYHRLIEKRETREKLRGEG